jgi:hypothetical protein
MIHEKNTADIELLLNNANDNFHAKGASGKRANILARAVRHTTNKGESYCVRERIGKIDTLQCNK